MRDRKRGSRIRAAIMAVVAGFVFTAAGSPAIAADAVRAAFDGKQMRFFTMGSPGGGYDTHMRTLIPHLERKLGAKIMPLNETGAGGIVAMNRLITAAPDGLTILLTGGEGAVTGQLYEQSGVRYDVRELAWIARLSGEAKVMLLGERSPFKTVADMMKGDRPVIWAASGKTDGNSDFAAIVAHATGIKTRIIVGYKGSGGMNMAIETGEVDGRIVSEEAAALFVRGGKMRVVATLARERSHQFPDVPTIFEAVRLTADQARWIEWRASIAALGRLIVTTPGTPKDRVDFLRSTFREILTDPAVVAEIRKRNLAVGYASGEEVAKQVEAAMTTLDAARLAEVRDVTLNRYYGSR